MTPTTPSDSPDSFPIEVEDIPALLRDVARFAEAVDKLKDVVLAEGEYGRGESWSAREPRLVYGFPLCSRTCGLNLWDRFSI